MIIFIKVFRNQFCSAEPIFVRVLSANSACSLMFLICFLNAATSVLFFAVSSTCCNCVSTSIIGSNSCTYATVIHVGLESDEDCKLHFYTGITPNGDGRNDKWVIENIEQFPNNHVLIFNRWGQEIFESNHINDEWDGTFNGEPVPEGVYVWVAEATSNNGREFTERGTVTLIR